MTETVPQVLGEYWVWKWFVGCPKVCLGIITPWEYLDTSFDFYHRSREAFTRSNPDHPWTRRS